MSFLNKNVSETQIRLKDRLWLYIFAYLILFLLIVPSLVVIPMSFSASQYLEFPPREWSLRWYENYFLLGKSKMVLMPGCKLLGLQSRLQY